MLQTHARASWSAVAVGRILHNPVYIGTLAQGKETTPNYKVKKRVRKPESEWHVVEGAHEPVIKRSDFEIVNGLLLQDTRTAPGNDAVFPLSGLVFCGDCGNSMVRKKSERYGYYVCAASKAGKGCTSHAFGQGELERAVMEAVTKQIGFLLDIEGCIEYLRTLPYRQSNGAWLGHQIADREKEIRSCEGYRRSLYEDYKNGDKTICGSKNSKHPANHVVSAWVAATHITLGELAVDEKSNEITAIPELLDLIDVESDIITIDAMGCQISAALIPVPKIFWKSFVVTGL